MRNELAREYNLPNEDGAAVNLYFLENKIREAWGVGIRNEETGRAVYATGATPRRAYAKAYAQYVRENHA